MHRILTRRVRRGFSSFFLFFYIGTPDMMVLTDSFVLDRGEGYDYGSELC